MNLEKFEAVPNSVLKDITEKPAAANPEPATEAKTSTNGGGVKGAATIEDIFKANNNTKVSPLSVADGPTGQPTTDNISGIQQNSAGTSVSVGQMLESKLAIELIDAMLPALFVAMFHAIDVKLRKTELQLTQKEKDTIAPIMQACLNTIMLNFNSPWTTLAVTLGVIYGSKITEKGVVNWIDKLNEKKEQEALEEKTGLKVVHSVKEPVPVLKSNPLQNQSDKVVEQSIKTSPVFQEQKKPYSESEIKSIMKKRSIGRDRAIKVLDKKYNVQ